MIIGPPERARRVVPRWRSFAQLAALGELKPAVASRKFNSTLGQERFDTKVRRWVSERGAGSAAELIMFSVTTGRQSPELSSAVSECERSGAPMLRSLAKRMQPAPGRDIVVEAAASERFGQDVGRQRARLKFYQEDAIGWVELARAHASVGSMKKATRALSVALQLAPHNRYVVRCAARLFVNTHDFERAYLIVANAGALKADPWIAAAEVAISGLANRKPRAIKVGRSMIEGGSFHPRDLAEVAAAIATVELEAGNTKLAKKLFRTSLADPTENALAQAQWATHFNGVGDITPSLFDRPFTFEARSKRDYDAGRWKQCLESIRGWIRDEPFSRSPATIGSFVALEILDDATAAEDLAKQGLRVDPKNATLLNNLIVALARQGRVREAFDKFRMLRGSVTGGEGLVVHCATRGLLGFRTNDLETGRHWYMKAVELAAEAARQKAAPAMPNLLVRALLNWAIEEANVDPLVSPRLVHLAESVAADQSWPGGDPPPEIPALMERLRTRARLIDHERSKNAELDIVRVGRELVPRAR